METSSRSKQESNGNGIMDIAADNTPSNIDITLEDADESNVKVSPAPENPQTGKDSNSRSAPSSMETDTPLDLIAGRWAIHNSMDIGGNGEVFEGRDIFLDETVAIKIALKPKMRSLEYERDVYNRIWSFGAVIGIPKMLFYGSQQDKEVLVMTHHGMSIQHHFSRMEQTLSLKSVLMLGIQVVSRIEALHKAGLVHCDIKPQNLLAGNRAKCVIHLIDFGATRPYISILKRHISEDDRKGGFAGTDKYASISAHTGVGLSRKDDLQSLVYVLVYLFSGSLPWSNISIKDRGRHRRMVEDKKKTTSVNTLTSGMPLEVSIFADCIFKLGFREDPDYRLLRGLLRSALSGIRARNDSVFDWDGR